MLTEIALGTALMLATIAMAGTGLWIVESWLLGAHSWLTREPHGPKLMVLLAVAALWILTIVTLAVWLWALVFHALGLFATLEESVYFALVSFTTLGYGDLVLPPGWRLLGGMAAANGFMTFGLLIAMLADALRFVRFGQHERRRTRAAPLPSGPTRTPPPDPPDPPLPPPPPTSPDGGSAWKAG